jgi:predicted RNase H-like HicB family nuclease
MQRLATPIDCALPKTVAEGEGPKQPYASIRSTMERKLTAVIEKHGPWYVGYIKQIPGVNTQGRTVSSTLRNLADAFRLVQEENRRLVKKEKRIPRPDERHRDSE